MYKTMLLAVLPALLLLGCQSPGPAPTAASERTTSTTPQPAPPSMPPSAAPAPAEPVPAPAPKPTAIELALSEGIALYDAGDFNGAIKRLLGAKEIWETLPPDGSIAARLTAHKYIAFSYCVTNRRTQCRQQFASAIKLDPNFNLEPAEKTHPIWGPEFERAKKQAAAPVKPAKAPAGSPASPPAK